jgi:Rieske 2Fe-2S family protein
MTSVLPLAAKTHARVSVEELKAKLHRNIHAPRSVYLTDEVAELEKQSIFLTHWLCVARSEEVAAPGDYQTLKIAGEPIVVARTQNGTIAAYKNRCLHRGVEVADGSGNARRFSCPYHAWSYDIGGRLVATAAVDKETLDLKERCLPQLCVAEWRGWIFVNFDSDATPFETFIAPYEKTLWYYGAGECRLAFKKVFDLKCNWKFVAENLLDFYHARTIHAATFGSQYKLKDNALPFTPIGDGGMSFEFGSDMRKNAPNAFPRLSWLDQTNPDFQAGKGAIFPNINLFVNTDSVRSWTLWPGERPGETKAIFYFLLPKETFSVADFDSKLEGYRELVGRIADEDKPVLLSLQQAVASESYEPGPITHFEVGIKHLLSHYADVLTASRAGRP